MAEELGQDLSVGTTSLTLPNICDLPFEILVTITSFAEPPDIFSIGQTCRLMHLAFRERSVWYAAIHTILEKNVVFKPSFKNIYQLPNLMLHRIALDPYRFIRFIAKAQENRTTQPFLRSQLVSTLWLSHFRARRCHKLFLVPGGRYLFTLHRTNLHLWDLGFPVAHKVMADPILLVSTDVRSFAVNPSKHPNILRLRLRMPWNQQGCRHYEMHNVDFSVCPPRVTQISSLKLKTVMRTTFDSVDDERICILTGSVMTVWDFIQDEFVSWDTRTNPSQFFLDKDIVGVVDIGVLALWKIPTMQPNASETLINGSSPPPFIEPNVILGLPSPNLQYESCRAIGDWYTGSIQPIWFDMVEGPETSFVRLKLERTDPNDISTYKLVPYVRSALPKDNTPYGPQMRPCNDSAVLCWISKGRTVKCHVGPTFFDSPMYQDNYVVLCRIHRPTKRQFSLCPVTGKFCYVDYEENRIVVSDFLP